MYSNAYRMAAWGANADQTRQNAQNRSQMYQQFAPQMSQYRVGRQQYGVQQAQNQAGQRDKMFAFGINALGGLMR